MHFPGIIVYLFVCFYFLQEGANINKSLTTLGKVIHALAEQVGNYLCTVW